MKVLIVLTSNARRGAEIEGARLAAELTALGVEAEAVALAATPQDTYLDVPVLGRSALGISTLRELRRRARYVDVVIAYGSSSLPACAVGLLGSKVPFVYRSIGDPAAWVRGRFHRWRTGVLLRRSAHVVALWPAAAAALESLYSIEGDRISVITNARSPEEFRPPSAGERKMARQRFALGESEFVVGVVGSLSAEKRVDLAIDAVAGVPDARALVVGDGPLRLSITERACTTLGSRAVFTGAIDNVHQAFWAMDLLLITSRTEGMPGVMLEASMCGAPVVATSVGAVEFLYESGVTGASIPVGADASFVADTIQSFRAAVPTPSKPLCQKYTWGAVARLWAVELDRVVAAEMSESGAPR